MTTPAQLTVKAERWLKANPDAPLRDITAIAVVVIAKGDPDRPVSVRAVSELTGIPEGDVLQALWSALEEQELHDEERERL